MTSRLSADANTLVAAAAAPSGAATAREELARQQKHNLALRGNYLAALEAKKSDAYLARVRVQRLERELRETRVATASRGALEAKHNSMLEHKAWREAPKLQAGVGVAPAVPDEVLALSTLFNDRLADMYEDPALRQWFKLFRHIDDDNTGRITYSELARAVREELQLPPRKGLPDGRLQAVWAALDTDGSGYITAGEFGGFMRKGESAVPLELTWQARVLASKRAMAGQVRAAAEGDKWVAAGIEPASDEQVAALSQLIHLTLAQLYEDEPQQRSWLTLFKHMDDDGSGQITYAELAAMLRDELGLTTQHLPSNALRAAWAALDADRSGFITAGEFGNFMRRGRVVELTTVRPLDKRRIANQQARRQLEEQTARSVEAHCAELDRSTRQRRDQAERLESELAEARDDFAELMSTASQLSATLPTPRPLTALTTHRNPAPPQAPAAAAAAPADASAAPADATLTTTAPLPARLRTSQSARGRSKPLDLPTLYGPASARRFVRPDNANFVRPSSGVSHHGGSHAAKQLLAQSPLYSRPTPPASPRSRSALGRHGGGDPASP